MFEIYAIVQCMMEAGAMKDFDDYPDFDDNPNTCTNKNGHEFICTGTQYDGDDESYHGEGRSYCIHCGADGDA